MNSSDFVPELEQPPIGPTTNALFFRLREHHCISPSQPLPTWKVVTMLDEGIMNAYCPRDFPHAYTVIERNSKLRIRKHGLLGEYVYETYERGKGNSHDEETCEMCAFKREEEHERRLASLGDDNDRYVNMADDAEDVMDIDEDAVMDDASVDAVFDEAEADFARIARARDGVQHAIGPDTDVDQLIDHVQREDDEDDGASTYAMSDSSGHGTEVSRTCSGIQDIIITGEVSVALSCRVCVRVLTLASSPAPLILRRSCLLHSHHHRNSLLARPRANTHSHGPTSTSTDACDRGTGLSCSSARRCARGLNRRCATRTSSAGISSAARPSSAHGATSPTACTPSRSRARSSSAGSTSLQSQSPPNPRRLNLVAHKRARVRRLELELEA